MELKVIERSGQRVLITAQLAESYGADEKLIQQNFSNNKSRYKEGKHFVLLQGEELRTFKHNFENLGVAPNVNKLYLWTEKGAWLHAKSLNTDQAWDAYEMLVDEYYKAKEVIPRLNNLSPQLQLLINMEMEQNKLKAEMSEMKTTVNTITETFLQKDDDWRKSINQMMNRAVQSLGEDYRELRNRSYKLLEERARCNLDIRLTNLKNRLAGSGATKTKLNQTNKMDVIESDPRLKEIYTTIVKEFSIGSLKKKA